MIWPFITGSEQTLIILPDHPVSAHSLEGQSKPPEPRPAQSLRALMLSSPAVGHPAADSGACLAKWTLEPRNSRKCASPTSHKGGFTNQRGRENKAVTPVHHGAGYQNNAGQAGVLEQCVNTRQNKHCGPLTAWKNTLVASWMFSTRPGMFGCLWVGFKLLCHGGSPQKWEKRREQP